MAVNAAPNQNTPPPYQSAVPQGNITFWICPQCSVQNQSGIQQCTACHTVNPYEQTRVVHAQPQSTQQVIYVNQYGQPINPPPTILNKQPNQQTTAALQVQSARPKPKQTKKKEDSCCTFCGYMMIIKGVTVLGFALYCIFGIQGTCDWDDDDCDDLPVECSSYGCNECIYCSGYRSGCTECTDYDWDASGIGIALLIIGLIVSAIGCCCCSKDKRHR